MKNVLNYENWTMFVKRDNDLIDKSRCWRQKNTWIIKHHKVGKIFFCFENLLWSHYDDVREMIEFLNIYIENHPLVSCSMHATQMCRISIYVCICNLSVKIAFEKDLKDSGVQQYNLFSVRNAILDKLVFILELTQSFKEIKIFPCLSSTRRKNICFPL